MAKYRIDYTQDGDTKQYFTDDREDDQIYAFRQRLRYKQSPRLFRFDGDFYHECVNEEDYWYDWIGVRYCLRVDNYWLIEDPCSYFRKMGENVGYKEGDKIEYHFESDGIKGEYEKRGRVRGLLVLGKTIEEVEEYLNSCKGHGCKKPIMHFSGRLEGVEMTHKAEIVPYYYEMCTSTLFSSPAHGVLTVEELSKLGKLNRLLDGGVFGCFVLQSPIIQVDPFLGDDISYWQDFNRIENQTNALYPDNLEVRRGFDGRDRGKQIGIHRPWGIDTF